MQEFTDKVVVVTGAAGNLGKAVAQAFARQGAKLALLDMNEDGIQAVISELPDNCNAVGFPINLLEAEDVSQVFSDIVDQFSQIDVLANIAGGFSMGTLTQDIDDGAWDFMMNLNARSAFYTCRETIPCMLDNGGGRIINVSARAAIEGKGRMAAYCAAKSAVLTLTESLAAENKLDNINVNCVIPGTINTPQNRNERPDADHSKWVAPEALADVILFLASQASRSVTGAAVPVYGQS